jgi:hypothetical protein
MVEYDVYKVIKVFKSCKTYEQYLVAKRMAHNLRKMYGTKIPINLYMDLVDIRNLTLIRIINAMD